MVAVLAAATIATASPAVALVATPSSNAGIFAFIPARDPGTAALLSLAVNGAGQFYNGEPLKGWWMLSPWGLYPFAWLADTYFQFGYFRVGVLALALGVKGWSVWDAYATAASRKEQP